MAERRRVDDVVGQRVGCRSYPSGQRPGDLDRVERVLAEAGDRARDRLGRHVASQLVPSEAGLARRVRDRRFRRRELVHGARVRRLALHLDAAGRKRLADVDRRLRGVDLRAADRDQEPDHDAADETGGRQPPPQQQRVPVAAEVDLALGVEVRELALGRRPRFGRGAHAAGNLSDWRCRSDGSACRGCRARRAR